MTDSLLMPIEIEENHPMTTEPKKAPMPDPGKYRKKPTAIEAYCYNQMPENYRPDWFQDRVSRNEIMTYADHALIRTLEGEMRANLGDWIIKGIKGEVYPCKPEIFAATYEALSSRSEAQAPDPTPAPVELTEEVANAICIVVCGNGLTPYHSRREEMLAAARAALALTHPAPSGDPLFDLVRRFSDALLEKLRDAKRKYGYGDNWMRDGWADELREHIRRHVEKGDPRDVAAYCAFAWHHGWSLAPSGGSEAQADGDVAELEKRLIECRQRIGQMCCERHGPKMSIPSQDDDDDLFIDAAICEAQGMLTRLAQRLAKLEAERIVMQASISPEWRDHEKARGKLSLALERAGNAEAALAAANAEVETYRKALLVGELPDFEAMIGEPLAAAHRNLMAIAYRAGLSARSKG